MRHFILVAIALLAAAPAATAAAPPSWQPAAAVSVTGGVTSRKTFVIQAYVTLPTSCDYARIRTYGVNAQLHRSFIVEQLAPGTLCHGTPNYNCTIQSPTYQMPIQQPIDVHTKNKTWKIHLSMEPPAPIKPMCHSV